MEEQAFILPKKRFNAAIIIGGIAVAVFFDWLLDFMILRKGMDRATQWYLTRLTCWAVLPFLYQYSLRVEGRKVLIVEGTTSAHLFLYRIYRNIIFINFF